MSDSNDQFKVSPKLKKRKRSVEVHSSKKKRKMIAFDPYTEFSHVASHTGSPIYNDSCEVVTFINYFFSFM